MKVNQTSSAILIIGDEILSGRVQDVNVNYICKEMFAMGVKVQQVMIVPDEEEEIIFAVNYLRKKHSYVFTTGGIGPTHDDITALSISKAFKKNLVVNEEALEIQRKGFAERGILQSDNAKRMVMMPEGSKLILTKDTATPSFYIENVFVMAGIPDVMIDMFQDVKKHIKRSVGYISKSITVEAGESLIADILKQADEIVDGVSIGSYPSKKSDSWVVDVVFTGVDHSKIDQSLNMVKNNLLSQKITFEEKQ